MHRSYTAHTLRLILPLLVPYRLLARRMGADRRLPCPLQLGPVWAPLVEGQPAVLVGQPAFPRRFGVGRQWHSQWNPAGRMGELNFLSTAAVPARPRHSHLSRFASFLGE